MQLMVLGMHRSGTSVLARMLNLMGVYFGPEGASTGANQENPKGFWERRDVRDLNDMVLQSTGCDWNRVLEFDIETVPTPVIEDFNKRAAKLILDMDAHRPWLLKEPRLCLLLPLWRQFLEVPVCVHIVRHPVEVASSLRTRNKIPIEVGLILWDRYVKAAFRASAGLPGFVVSHRQMMEDPQAAVSKLFADLQAADVPNLRIPTDQEIKSFIRDDLYREREGRPELATYANSPQVRFFEGLAAGKPPRLQSLKPLSATARKALAAYEAGLPPVAPPKVARPAMPEPERVLREQLALKTQEVQLVRELVDKTSAESSSREERLVAINGELASLRGASTRLSEELRQRDERLALLDRELASAREASTKLSGELRQRDERLAVLDRELASTNAVSSKLSEELGQRDERLAAQAGELTSAQEASDKLSEHLRQSEEDNAELRRQIVDLTAALRIAEEARVAAETSASARFREIEILTRLLMDQEKEAREAESQVNSLNVRLAKSVASSTTERAHLIREVQKHSRAAAETAAKAAERAKAEATAKAEVRRLNEDRESLRRQLGQLTLKSANRRKCIEDMSQRLLEMNNSVDWRMTAPIRRFRRVLTGRPAVPATPSDDLEVIRQSELFDVAWYLEHNPDVSESGMDPVEHYLQYGAYEGRDPGPNFDTGYYLSRNADVAEFGMNPLAHYIRHGKGERRSTGNKGIRNG